MSRYRRRSALGGGGTPAYTFPTTTQDAYWITVGDSQRMGRAAGATTTPNFTDGARPLTVTQKTALRLRALGYDVSTDAFFGSGVVDTLAEYPLYNTQVTIHSSWTLGVVTMGGAVFTKAAASGAGAFTFTNTDKDCDTFDVYTTDDSTFSYTMTVTIDGVAKASISPSASTNTLIKKVTYTGLSVGTHTISLDVTAGTASILGIVARDSTHFRTIIINCGARGWSSADWNVNTFPWRPLALIDYLQPAMVDIALGGNDFRSGGPGLTQAQFNTNMQALIDSGLATGNVFLSYDFELAPASEGAITQANGRSYIDALAVTNGIGVVNTLTAAGTYAAINAAGNMVDDNHTNAVPMLAMGNAQANALQAGSLGAPKTYPIVFSDTLAIANGSNVLNGRTADVGGAWTQVNGTFDSTSNQVWGTANPSIATSPTIGGTDYSVQADAMFKSNLSNFVILRYVDSLNYYAGGYRASANGWVIMKVLAGVASNLASMDISSNAPDANELLNLKLLAMNTTVNGVDTVDLRFYVNGNLKLKSVADTSFRSAGKAALFSSAVNSSTTGMHFSNFLVRRIRV